MKNKKFDKQHERYRQLIMRMESRRNKGATTTKNTINIRDLQMNNKNNNDFRYPNYAEDDIRVRQPHQRIGITNKIMPNSTKNYRYNEVQKNNISPQQYFKKSESQRSTNNWYASEDDNRRKLGKQFFYERNLDNNDQIESNKEYQKLHEKLDSIENKISEMKNNLQKKRQEKRHQEQKRNQNKSTHNQNYNPLKGFVTQVSEHQNVHPLSRNPYSPKHNIYYVSQVIKAYKDQHSIVRQHLHTSLQILRMLQNAKIPTNQEVTIRKINLPRRPGFQNKKTVVFDLDETLIHCNQTLENPYDVKLPITFPTGEVIEAGINIRPYAYQIIKNLSQNFQVIVFTASHSCYANVVLDHLDPGQIYVHHRLFREHCHATPEGIYIKDLRVIDRDLNSMVLVDNAAYSYAFQLQNGIPIIPYYHGTTDFELNALQKYLEQMLLVKDVREVNRKTFKLHEYSKYYHDPDKLVEEIYKIEEKMSE